MEPHEWITLLDTRGAYNPPEWIPGPEKLTHFGRHISIANVLELLQSCTKPSICTDDIVEMSNTLQHVLNEHLYQHFFFFKCIIDT